jgi:hypothetical protein
MVVGRVLSNITYKLCDLDFSFELTFKAREQDLALAWF